jgi:sulfatase modifying factor 1
VILSRRPDRGAVSSPPCVDSSLFRLRSLVIGGWRGVLYSPTSEAHYDPPPGITRIDHKSRTSLKAHTLWLASLACLLSVPAVADQITYQEVTVGDPGNANDTGGVGIGAVAYSYQIGKYDVTIGQYAAFLNAVAATDTYSLYNPSMASDGNIKGIQQNGSSGSYTYSVIGSGDRPITYVSWFDSARFANWMTNGQGSGSTETGAYTLNGATSGNAVTANAGAAFRIPTLNEWYKAAYYAPTLNSGAGGYYTYPTQSNDAPGNTIGSTANQANCITGAGYSVTQSPSYDSNQNYLTDVGAFSGSGSFYGTFDQGGNVFQWNDLIGAADGSRGIWGGPWNGIAVNLSSSSGASLDPSNESSVIGFRLASPVSEPGPSSVPEIDPNSLGSVLVLVLGSLGLLERRRLKAA